MGQKQTGKYCNHCKKNVMATGTIPNHLLHFIFIYIYSWHMVDCVDIVKRWENRRIPLFGMW